jgi:hypothetical protein
VLNGIEERAAHATAAKMRLDVKFIHFAYRSTELVRPERHEKCVPDGPTVESGHHGPSTMGFTPECLERAMDASGVNVDVSWIFGMELERHRDDGYIIARLGSSPDHDRVPPWLIEVPTAGIWIGFVALVESHAASLF